MRSGHLHGDFRLPAIVRIPRCQRPGLGGIIFPVNLQRVLIAVVTGAVMVHRVEDDAGVVLRSADQPFGPSFVSRLLLRVVEPVSEIFYVGQREGRQHTRLVRRLEERVQIADGSWRKIVSRGDRGVESVLLKTAARVQTAFEGTPIRLCSDVFRVQHRADEPASR